jgi:uncharacterized membrane protein YvbJ
MKFCKNCGIEIDTQEGENYCADCDLLMANDDKAGLRRRRTKMRRKEREQVLKDLGLRKVYGSLGGVYWE